VWLQAGAEVHEGGRGDRGVLGHRSRSQLQQETLTPGLLVLSILARLVDFRHLDDITIRAPVDRKA